MVAPRDWLCISKTGPSTRAPLCGAQKVKNQADPTMAQGRAFRQPHGRSQVGRRSPPALGSSLHSIPWFVLKFGGMLRLNLDIYLRAPHRCHGPTTTTLNLMLGHTSTKSISMSDFILYTNLCTVRSPNWSISPGSVLFSHSSPYAAFGSLTVVTCIDQEIRWNL